MNIWIITTGSSDVQLKTKENWNHLYRQIRNKCDNRDFSPSRPTNADGDEPFQVPARVMGIVYGENIEEYDNLCFPIFETLSAKLFEIKATPDKIIVITTDQSEIFPDSEYKRSNKCPYWQDTCSLQEIFKLYFLKKFPNTKLEFCELKPFADSKGLDDWNNTLTLVQDTLGKLQFASYDTIYVSHQAGTPAISSAIQFMSLAKFGKQVKFLVSSEYKQNYTDIIPSYNYLRAIQIQEAKALLERYDYAGVERLLKPYLQDTTSEIRRLLKIATLWNYAEFDEFAKQRGEAAEERIKNWWWIGYEAAYLALVRLEQENTVEALFHSFRAAEGLILEWAINKYDKYIDEDDKGYKLKDTILKVLPKYVGNLSFKQQANFREYRNIPLYSDTLFKLLQTARPESKTHPYMKLIWNDAKDERNEQFHRLLGLTKKELFRAWNASEQSEWERKILGCLEFISGQKFPSLKAASLMSQVHDELREALNKCQHNLLS
ncbi:MAG: hypothetical protein KME64_15960 [Scytonematopsis contorta HA4267-MV1]|jgi:hypothetical protein|nr:hypothetical protein [Scytonematopsis contorta HA4267-MV1]